MNETQSINSVLEALNHKTYGTFSKNKLHDIIKELERAGFNSRLHELEVRLKKEGLI